MLQLSVHCAGVETTPSDICATQEIHINGDIVFAMQQYWWATGNLELFDATKSKFVDVVFGIADFWISRSTYNSTIQMFEISRKFMTCSLACYSMQKKL